MGELIRKIKVDKSGKIPKILIRYDRPVPGEDDEFDNFSLKSSDEPLPSLHTALQALNAYVVETCEAKDCWTVESVDILGVSFTYQHDSFGAVVSAKKELQGSGSPLVINTPYRRCFMDDQPEGEIFFEPLVQRQLETLQKEAMRYIKGERAFAQLSLLDTDVTYEEALKQAKALAAKHGFAVTEVRQLVLNR